MDKILIQKLKINFPTLLKDIDIINTGNGWFEHISKTCSQIKGEGHNQCVITTISESCGSLRINVTNANHAIHEIVDEAERKSETICEICGSSGRLQICNDEHKQPMIKTTCNDCYRAMISGDMENACEI